MTKSPFPLFTNVTGLAESCTMISCRSDLSKETWPDTGQQLVCLDCEEDTEQLVDGSHKTFALWASKIAEARRRYPSLKVGFSGIPNPPRGQEHLYAKGMRDIISLCDYISPCCYDWMCTDEEMIERTNRFKSCIEIMGLSHMTIYPRVSPTFQLVPDENSIPIPQEKLERQVVAAKLVGGSGLIVWTGLEYKKWAAGLESVNPQVKENIRKARDAINHIYGIFPISWKPRDVAFQCNDWMKIRMRWFKHLWHTTG